MRCVHAILFEFLVTDTSHQNTRIGWRMVTYFHSKFRLNINFDAFMQICFSSSDPDVLVEKKVKDVKKTKDDSKENFDLSDIEKSSQDGFLVGAVGSLPETLSFESDLSNIGIASNVQATKENIATIQAVSLEKLEINSPDSATTENNNQTSACIVCNKTFKSKSCMNKHLRSVHTGLSIFRCISKNFFVNQIIFILLCFDSESADWR